MDEFTRSRFYRVWIRGSSEREPNMESSETQFPKEQTEAAIANAASRSLVSLPTMNRCLLAFLLSSVLHLGIPFLSKAAILDRWTTNQVTTNGIGFTQLLYANGVFVAAGWYSDWGGIYTSTDGLNWVFRYSEGNSWGLNLNYSQGHFATVSPWGVVLRSTDGTNWSKSRLPDQYYYRDTPRYITFGGTRYVVVGETNGVGIILAGRPFAAEIIWTQPVITPGAGGRIIGVIYDNSRFVAFGDGDGLAYISTTGASTWSRINIPVGSSMAYDSDASLYTLGTGTSTNWISNDLTNWFSVSAPNVTVFGHINGLFYGITNQNDQNKLATSLDKTQWVVYPPTIPEVYGATGVATDGKRLVTVTSVLTNTGPWYFNSFVYTSDPLVELRMTNAPSAKVALSGLVGRSYQIQSTDSLNPGGNTWVTNVAVQLTNTSFLWTDPTATNSQRFYRAALLP
jgi:hypothetical protein